MQEATYEFDPAELDGSQDDPEESVTLDNWKPTPKTHSFRAPSKWRHEMNCRGLGYMEPGLDEIHKIRTYLKNKISDLEIMDQFAINADTLTAIKNNRYDPVDGILENQNQVLQRKCDLLEKRIEDIKKKIKSQVTTLCSDDLFAKWIDERIMATVASAMEGMSIR